jgi:epoxyqueuosine reductase
MTAMITSNEIKNFVLAKGVEKCGIASVERFLRAPEGFRPTDIYKKTQSIIVFLKQMPSEIIMADNPIPYTHSAYLIYSELDRIGMEVCQFLQKNGNHGIPVPTDTPYLFWDETNKQGRGILSLRHAGYFAGLGFLGRNTLLINEELGNMLYIGAVLTDSKLDPDPMIEEFGCPENCTICLNACPKNALDGITVNQKLCREISFYKTARGFDVYDCNACRQLCILRTGIPKKT